MKKIHTLNTCAIAVKNLKARKFRTAFMIFFVMLMTGSLIFSMILLSNMKQGIENTTKRMGADMIVVPSQEEDGLRESLFSGTPCNISFDKEWVNRIAKVKGVARVTPQLYLATEEATCCTAPLQLIAFDPETDFVVQPWLRDAGDLQEVGGVIIGSHVLAEVGDAVTFFGEEFKVVGKLERTGMGYDDSVFMTFATIYALKDSEIVKQNLETENIEDQISMVMLLFQNLISTTFDIPYFNSSLAYIGKYSAGCLAVSMIIGLLVGLFSSYKISCEEPYRLIRENE